MEAKDVRNLQEAYLSVYQPQYISEEVEIATEYFYEMGLNEHGIDILIEELGEDEFVDWVDEIVEECILTEARAGGVKVEPVTKSGKSVADLKGGARSAAISRLRREKQAARAGEATSSAPSGMKAALQRQSAVASAQKKQPASSSSPTQTRQGIGARIGAAFGGAVKRAQQDIKTTRKTAQTVGKAVRTGIDALNTASDSRLARQARVITKKGFQRQQKAIDTLAPAVGRTVGKAAAKVPAIRDTYKAGQKLGRALRAEDYDYIFSHLLDEGYASTAEGAEVILMNMSEEWIMSVLEG